MSHLVPGETFLKGQWDPWCQVAEEVFQIAGRDPMIDIATSLMDAARSDEFFIKRKLYPNVDFFSGLVYRAMGFPPQFFTVLFAVPRWVQADQMQAFEVSGQYR